MIFLPDTNACIALLRKRDDRLNGAERSSDPAREHSKLVTFDDECARRCAEVRAELERSGRVIGPHDLQIAAVALQHGLTLVTHNTQEFGRISGLNLDDWEA